MTLSLQMCVQMCVCGCMSKFVRLLLCVPHMLSYYVSLCEYVTAQK